MKVFNFRRICNDGVRVFGVILYKGIPFKGLWFMENYLKRIKTGEYISRRDQEGKQKGNWELQNVTGRTEIIIHIANWVKQLLGCFGIGKGIGNLNDEPALLRSGDALEEFMNFTKDDEAIKIIVEEPQDGMWVS